MSDDPSEGVVDSIGRVHSISNLHIAGSSVFPTVGFANPTFTIIALTLRLAEHVALLLKNDYQTLLSLNESRSYLMGTGSTSWP